MLKALVAAAFGSVRVSSLLKSTERSFHVFSVCADLIPG